MVEARDYVDVNSSNGTVDVRVAALVEAVLASALLGYYYGLVGFITDVGGGVSNAIDDYRRFLYGEGGLLSSTFAIATDAIGVAFESNAEFIGMFGTFGFVVALIEAIVLVWLLVAASSIILSKIREGLL
jgi:hypothetical protein